MRRQFKGFLLTLCGQAVSSPLISVLTAEARPSDHWLRKSEYMRTNTSAFGNEITQRLGS